MYYLYSWSDRNQEGYRQTINEQNQVIYVCSIPISEAKEMYEKYPDGQENQPTNQGEERDESF